MPGWLMDGLDLLSRIARRKFPLEKQKPPDSETWKNSDRSGRAVIVLSPPYRLWDWEKLQAFPWVQGLRKFQALLLTQTQFAGEVKT